MSPLVAMSWVLLTASPKVAAVEVVVNNDHAAGVLEVLGADGGVVWSGEVTGQTREEVPSSARYTLRFSRRIGVLSTQVDDAAKVFSMNVEIAQRHIAVETFEPATDIEVNVMRSSKVAPLYSLRNRGSQSWVVAPFIWVDGLGLNQASHCWSQGARLEPRKSASIGWIDEMCLLDGAKKARAYFELRVEADSKALRRRTFVVSSEVLERTAGNRWIPDAGQTPGCICTGTQVGPDKATLMMKSATSNLYELQDGGLR